MTSDIVIKHMIKVFGEQFNGKSVVAKIVDYAEANDPNKDIQRSGWSAALASRLGYRYSGTDEARHPIYSKQYK